MANFISNLFNKNKEADNHDKVDLEEVNKSNIEKRLNIDLSLHPKDEASVSNFQKEFIKEELAELPPINKGEVNIASSYIYDIGESYEASIYIRNGLESEMSFQAVPLSVINSNGEVLASQIFDLIELGNIPPMSARPWKICFNKSSFSAKDIDIKDCKIVFDSNIKALKTVNVTLSNLPEGIGELEKRKYEEFIENLPRLEKNTLSISTYSLEKDNDNNIVITIVIRNGSNKEAKLEKLPVKVVDKDGNIIVSGTFELTDEEIKVGSLSAILHRFIFQSNICVNTEIDLSKCKVSFN